MSLSELQIVRKELSRIETHSFQIWKNMDSVPGDKYYRQWQRDLDRLHKIEQKMKKRMEELIG